VVARVCVSCAELSDCSYGALFVKIYLRVASSSDCMASNDKVFSE
jgi:hypothetical protein